MSRKCYDKLYLFSNNALKNDEKVENKKTLR